MPVKSAEPCIRIRATFEQRLDPFYIKLECSQDKLLVGGQRGIVRPFHPDVSHQERHDRAAIRQIIHSDRSAEQMASIIEASERLPHFLRMSGWPVIQLYRDRIVAINSMNDFWPTWLFSAMWRLLLRLEDLLEGSLLWGARNAISILLWLAAIFLPCAGSFGILVRLIRPQIPHYWLACAEMAILAGAMPTVVLLVCLCYMPRRFATWTVSLGIAFSWALAVWFFYLSLADD